MVTCSRGRGEQQSSKNPRWQKFWTWNCEPK